MQRLFSNFANGWPGIGLLLLRLLTGAMMIYFGIASLGEAPPPLILVLQMIGVGSAVLLVVGLLTPIAGSLGAVAKVWIGILRISPQSGDPWIAIAQAVLPAAVAMIGPGAWSVDGRLFGRKHIDLSDL